MATYAIGDVQGCYGALRRLIDAITLDPARDRLWFVGDLVNRGPASVQVLRFVKGLGPTAVTVLGNHDLHLLTIAEGIRVPRPQDTVQDVLRAPDRHDLLAWLRNRPLLYREGEFVLVHAGLLPGWTVPKAISLAGEVEATLRGAEAGAFLRYFFHHAPGHWSESLTGLARLAVIASVLTRLRVCSDTGEMALSFKGPPEDCPKGYRPWFEVPGRRSAEATIICGHWAALGLRMQPNLLALDAGCAWGRQLAAVRLEDRHVFQVACTRGCRDGG